MRIEDLGKNFPKLFHMAEDGSWPRSLGHESTKSGLKGSNITPIYSDIVYT